MSKPQPDATVSASPAALTSGVVIVRLFAVFLLVDTVQHVAWYGGYLLEVVVRHGLAGEWNTARLASELVAMLAPLIVAVLLWRYADVVAGSATQREDTPTAPSDLLTIGIALIGLYAFVFGVVDMVATESGIAHAIESGGIEPGGIDRGQYRSMRVEYAVQLALGLLLIVGKRRLARSILDLRYAAR